MSKIIVLLTLLMGANVFATTPMEASEETKAFYSQFDKVSAKRLKNWFQNNNTVGDFGGSDACFIEGDSETPVFITSKVYGGDGIYALGIGGEKDIDGFSRITQARVAVDDHSLLILWTDDIPNRVICKK